MSHSQLKSLSDVLFRPPFYLKSAFEIHPKFSSILQQIVRIPHRYAFAYWTSVTDEHLSALQAVSDYKSVLYGEGCSLESQSEAAMISVYEATERLFGFHADTEKLVYGSWLKLQPSAVHPQEFILPREWEYEQCSYPYIRYRDALEIHWLPCYQIEQEELVPRLIPATLAVTGYGLSNPEERFVPILSNGFAAGTRFAETILRGIYELIERDAFMITWLNKLSSPRVRITQPFHPLSESLDRLASDGFIVDFVNITTDVEIPVILTVIEHQESRLRASDCKVFGLGCHLSPDRALMKSYTEALRLLLNYYEFTGDEELQVRDFDLYSNNSFFDEHYFSKTSFLKESNEVASLDQIQSRASGDLERNLFTCLDILRRHNMDVFFADFTPDEMRDSSYCLTRTFVSRLQPHLYEHDFWRLDNARIFEAPVLMRQRKSPLSEKELNLLPNPFSLR